MSKPNLTDLKAAYARNENITQILRGPSGTAINDQAAKMVAAAASERDASGPAAMRIRSAWQASLAGQR